MKEEVAQIPLKQTSIYWWTKLAACISHGYFNIQPSVEMSKTQELNDQRDHAGPEVFLAGFRSTKEGLIELKVSLLIQWQFSCQIDLKYCLWPDVHGIQRKGL